MVERTLSNLTITEYTIYEASKCLRRSFLFSKHTVYNLFQNAQKIKKRTLTYIPYDESLKYHILKKIYYYSVEILIKNGKLNFEEFKKFSIFIIEKEIQSNREKTSKNNLRQSNYNEIKKNIILELDKHFLIINPYDFEKSVSRFLSIDINSEEIINIGKNKLRKEIKDKILSVDFNGVPKLKLDILSIEKLNDYSFNIIMTSILNINYELIHNNYILAILFIYFKDIFDFEKNMNGIFNEYVFLNEIIIYNPLTMNRIKIEYKDIMGTFSLNEFIKLVKIYNDGLDFKNLNQNNCEHCENELICLNKNTTISKKKIIALKRNKKP
ncbi:hypothetical protein [Cetobacterium sp.]|uniref:hypothetical protein n=1 Tax=Cetobacterium sp. TaxID=2071632 RepID=UPI003F3DA321